MKKFLTLMLAFSSLAGCGGSPSKQDATEKADAPTQEVQKKNSNEQVTITYSPDLTNTLVALNKMENENYTKEDLIKSFDGEFKDAKLNDDGSITFSISKSDYEKIKANYKDEVDKAISDFINNKETGTTITDVAYNDDMSHFDVTLSGDTVNLADGFSVLIYYLYGGMYSAFTGNKTQIVTVDFKNKNGDIISSSSSTDLNK